MFFRRSNNCSGFSGEINQTHFSDFSLRRRCQSLPFRCQMRSPSGRGSTMRMEATHRPSMERKRTSSSRPRRGREQLRRISPKRDSRRSLQLTTKGLVGLEESGTSCP
uniref:(northern house mosquito) hypothetical protein n=1 Tax=Culex pipiens TaxID=7175 RepID=A0A8D8B7S2_CULPI